MKTPVVLTIAGSDSGGGAGLQADIRAISATGGFPTTVVTCTTAQNLAGVSDVHLVPSSHVVAQCEAVTRGFAVAAVKTGMLATAELVHTVADVLAPLVTQGVPLVIDPVMVARSGDSLLAPEAVAAYKDRLVPLATVLTPNVHEVGVLLRGDAHALSEMGQADVIEVVQAWCTENQASVILKKVPGGEANVVQDVLCTSTEAHWFRRPEVTGTHTHGTGCTLSAALASYLAQGYPLHTAATLATNYIQRALTLPFTLEGPSGDTSVLGRG